jgi:hypothetical protein
MALTHSLHTAGREGDLHILEADTVLKALAAEHRKSTSLSAYETQLKKAQVGG